VRADESEVGRRRLLVQFYEETQNKYDLRLNASLYDNIESTSGWQN